MIVHKCEKCKKEIEDSNSIKIGKNWFPKEFCIDCGKKLLSKLGQKELINHG